MTTKITLDFQFQFEGDGSTQSVTINLATGPISYQPPAGSASELSPLFNATPTAVKSGSCTCNGSQTVSSATIAAGVLTVSFSTTPASGTVYLVSGTFEF